MRPPLSNQPLVQSGGVASQEHYLFLLELQQAVADLQTSMAAVQSDVTALETISGETALFGPFHTNDLAASATTNLNNLFFNTATAVGQDATQLYMPRAGRVVGMWITSEGARATGTATAQLIINATPTSFNSGAVKLDGTNTNKHGGLVSWANGVPFVAGDVIRPQVVSSSWSPTTANINVHFLVRYEPL